MLADSASQFLVDTNLTTVPDAINIGKILEEEAVVTKIGAAVDD